MAKMVLLAAYVNLNAVDLSTYGATAELVVEVEDKEVTTFGSLGWKEYLGGLKSGSLKIKFKQDVAVGNLDSLMWPLLGTVIAFEVRLTNGARTTSNPAYTGNVLVKKWAPLSGSVGDVAEVDVEYPTTGAVTRATS
jgi:hypothetical protein